MLDNNRLDLFGALMARSFLPVSSFYNSSELFSLSLPSFTADSTQLEIYIKRISNSSPQRVFSSTEKTLNDNPNSCYHSTTKLNAKILLGIMGFESDLFDLAVLPCVTGQISNGLSLVLIKKYVSKFRSVFVMRALIKFCFHSIKCFSDAIFSAACRAFLNSAEEVMFMVDTSILTMLKKIDSGVEECELNQIWESTLLHRNTIRNILYFLSPQPLFHCLLMSERVGNANQNEISFETFTLKSFRSLEKTLAEYFTPLPWIRHYASAEECFDGWSLLENLLSVFMLQRVPSFIMNSENVVEQAEVPMSELNCKHHNGGLSGFHNFQLILTCHIMKSVSFPLLTDLHNKLYRIQPEAVSDNSNESNLCELLITSLDSVWNSTTNGSDSIVEQLLAASKWSESRIAILQPSAAVEEGLKMSSRNSQSNNNVEIQRREIRQRLTSPFTDSPKEIVIPTMQSELSHMKHTAKVSTKVCSHFQSDLNKVIDEWMKKPSQKSQMRGSVAMQPRSEMKMEVIEATTTSSLVDDASSEDEEGKEDSLGDIQIMPLQLDKNILHRTDAETDSQKNDLLSYFYSSPLNVVRVVSKALVVEAKNLITAKYDKLTHEVEMRKFKAVWQIQRLKTMQKTRQFLIQLRTRDMEAWSLELAHHRRSTPAPALFLDAPVFESDDENLELANESTLIDIIPSDNVIEVSTADVEMPLPSVETFEEISTVPVFIEYPICTTDSVQSLIYGGISVDESIIPQPVISPFSDAKPLPVPSITLASNVNNRESDTSSNSVVAASPAFSSVRISQSPGGRSTISLAHDGQQFQVDSKSQLSLTKPDSLDSAAQEASLDDATTLAEFAHPVSEEAEETIDVDAHFAATLIRKKNRKESPLDNLEGIADHLLHPNLHDLSDEFAIQDTLASLPQSLYLLGASLGIVEINDETDGDVNDVDNLIRVRESELNLVPCAVMISSSVGEAIKWQCRALNLAALYSLLAASDLLGHLDTVEKLCLVSPKSDFLISLSSHMVNSFVEQYDLFNDGHSRPNGSIRRLEEGLWSQYRLQDAVSNASTRNHINVSNTKYLSLIRFTLNSRCSDATSTTMNPMDELFSVEGLQSLIIEYTSSWPIPVVLTSEFFTCIAKMTRRLLELSQLTELLRILWIQLRIRQRAQTSNMSNVMNAMSRKVLEREVMNCFRLIQSTAQAVFNYLSDRVHSLGLQLRERIRKSAAIGLDEALSAIQQYATSLGDAALQWNANHPVMENVEDLEPVDGLKWHMDRMLQYCRRTLQTFLEFCRSNSNELDSSNNEDEIGRFLTMVGTSTRNIEELRRDIVNSCVAKSILPSERMNIEVLLMYLEI